MKKKSLKLVSIICLIVITIFQVTQVQSSSQTDPLNDVISITTLTVGDYADYIDIHQIEMQGSTIIITTEQGLASLSSLKQAYFIALLSEDGDPTNFEAAILLSYLTSGQSIVCWTLTDPLNDLDLDWTVDYSGTHSLYEENILQLFFLEFDGIIQSEVLLITFVDEGGTQYSDWTINAYDYSTIRSIIDTISFTLPPVVVTPDTPTPTTFPTTNYPETTVSTEASTTVPKKSSKETTTSTEVTTSTGGLFPTSGFSILSIILLIPLGILIKKQRKI